MIVRNCKIKVEWLLILLLFFSLFKFSYIPGSLRQAIKIISLLIIFLFLLKKIPSKKLFNISLVFPTCVMLSGIVSYCQGGNTLRSLLESLLYSLLFYDGYTLVLYFKIRNRYNYFLKSLYGVVGFFVAINIVTILVFGADGNMEPIYLLGNKFISSYMMIFLTSLYGATHDMESQINRVKYYSLIVISIILCLYMRSITALIGLLFVLFSSLYKNIISKIITSPKVLMVSMIASAGVIFVFDYLLNIPTINYLVFSFFGKSISIFGRQVIYNKYLKQLLIGERLWIGSGYNNSAILMMSGGVFGNAQNGLMEHFVAYGILGVLAILFTSYYCLKKVKINAHSYYILLTVYAMIIAATVEVTINWFFFMSLFMIANSDGKNIHFKFNRRVYEDRYFINATD